MFECFQIAVFHDIGFGLHVFALSDELVNFRHEFFGFVVQLFSLLPRLAEFGDFLFSL